MRGHSGAPPSIPGSTEAQNGKSLHVALAATGERQRFLEDRLSEFRWSREGSGSSDRPTDNEQLSIFSRAAEICSGTLPTLVSVQSGEFGL
jgi:hypothetical protein